MVARKHTDERAAKKRPSSTRITTGSKSNRKEPPQEQNEFLDLMIDTAFKFVFSKKQFMIPLLNSILQREDPIADITYLPTEQVAEYKQGRKVVFDLSCKTNEGCIFVIEMQYQNHPYFRERAFYYLIRKIEKELSKEDRKKGKKLSNEEKLRRKVERYRLNPIYGIYLTGFHLDADRPRLLRDIVLTDKLDDHQQFTDVFRMLFVELPSAKQQEDCNSLLEEFAYVIHNSRNMKEMPFTDKNPLFKELDKTAREHCMSAKEREAYEYERMNRDIYESQMADRFLKGRDKGREEGRAEGEAKGRVKEKLENAKRLISEKGWSLEEAASFFGLAPEAIALS